MFFEPMSRTGCLGPIGPAIVPATHPLDDSGTQLFPLGAPDWSSRPSGEKVTARAYARQSRYQANSQAVSGIPQVRSDLGRDGV